MKELIFVGASDGSLNKLRKALQSREPAWQLRQTVSGASAIEQLQHRPAGLLITDVDDAPALFDDVRQSCPGAIRLAWLDKPTADNKVRGAHQCIARREDLDYVHPIIDACLDVAGSTINQPELSRIIANLTDVPSPPALYFDIREQIDSASGDLTGIAQVAGKDTSLIARILKVVNSGFYALPRSISDLSEAIGFIGSETTLGLVLAAELYSGLPPPGLRLEVLWEHSQQVATLAKLITKHEGGNLDAQNASAVAGMLHDIGLIVLLANETRRYHPLWQRASGDESMLAELERETFGITHGELGALILKLWSLPSEIVEAVAMSHSDAPNLPVCARAVLAAEWLVDTAGVQNPDTPPALASLPGSVIAEWREAGQVGLATNLSAQAS